MPILTGKVIVVTGASRGIGLEFVRQLTQKGNRVVAACRSPEKAKQKILDTVGSDTTVEITKLDVSNAHSIAEWAVEMSKRVPYVDVVINNAGIYGERLNLDQMTAENMEAVFRTNTIGPLLVVQQLRRHRLLGNAKNATQSTLIANVTSKVGSVSDNQSGGGYAYRSSKAALNVINKSLSIDLAAENIVSTLLHPGWVITDMVNNNGLITTEVSVSGMLAVLESKSEEELQGTWHDYKNEEIPW